MLLVRGAHVFAPEDLGIVDVLVEGERILNIGVADVDAVSKIPGAKILHAEGLRLVPGFIDPHVHLIGGGGEGGYHNRTPEILSRESAAYGVTTVIGLLGTDGVSRTTVDLLAKARALETEGLSSYVLTGNYRVPLATVTSNVLSDIMIIDKVIGAGEVAISDNRSSCPTTEELARLASDCHVGGLLTGKAGVVHFHVGKESGKLSQLHDLIDNYDVPAMTLYPTHIARSEELLEDAARLSGKGSFVDITADEKTADDVARFVSLGGDLSRLTLSSDSNGSLPVFDDVGRMTGIAVAHQNHLYESVWNLAERDGFSLSDALSLVTSNTADVLKLSAKGRIEVGRDADFLLVDEEATIVHEYARGACLISDRHVNVKGSFDD